MRKFLITLAAAAVMAITGAVTAAADSSAPEAPYVCDKVSSVTAIRATFFDDSVGYKVRISKNKDFSDSKVLKATDGTVRFTDLVPNTTYYLKAVSYKKVGSEYKFSEATTFTCKTKKLEAPELKESSVDSTDNGLYLAFYKTNTKFRVRISANKDYSNSKVVSGGTATEGSRLCPAFTYFKCGKLKLWNNHTYYVKAVAYVTSGGKTYYSKATEFTVKSSYEYPKSTAYFSKNSVKVKWKDVSGNSGYAVTLYNRMTCKSRKKYVSANATSCTFTNLNINNSAYDITVQAYKKNSSGKKILMGSSHCEYSPETVFVQAKLTPHRTFKVIDDSTKETMYNITLTDNDIALLKNFAAKHFTKGMTRYDKILTTAYWIHSNVDYAYYGTDEFDFIYGQNGNTYKTYVQAVFKYKKGECDCYNGALVAMMAYMGYDVKLVVQNRNTTSQHVTGELVVNGLAYRLETGNKDDGLGVSIAPGILGVAK